jgi:hypothetical protein
VDIQEFGELSLSARFDRAGGFGNLLRTGSGQTRVSSKTPRFDPGTARGWIEYIMYLYVIGLYVIICIVLM